MAMARHPLSCFGYRFGLIVSLLAIGLVGCASQPPASQSAAKLKVWIQFSDNPKLFQDTFAKYAKANNVQVEVVCPAPLDKILAALSSSDAPDIVALDDYVTAQSVAFRGLTLDLKELGTQGGIDFNDIYPAALVSCQQAGKFVCLPWGVDANALFWNKDLFEAAGLDPNKPPKTLDEMAAYADRLTKKDAKGNLTQVGYLPGFPWPVQDTLLWKFGSGAYANDGRTLTVNTPANVKAFKWAQQFFAKPGARPVIDLRSGFGTYASSENGFFAGKVAMVFDGEWLPGPNFIPKFAPALSYGVAPLPVPADRLDAYGSDTIGGTVVLVPAATKDRAATAKLLAWMESPEIIAEVMSQNSNLPSNNKAALDPRFRQLKHFQTFIDIMAHPKSTGETSSPIHQELDHALSQAVEQMEQEGADPEQLLNAIQKEFEPKLADAWKKAK